jgi:hypothetical protein
VAIPSEIAQSAESPPVHVPAKPYPAIQAKNVSGQKLLQKKISVEKSIDLSNSFDITIVSCDLHDVNLSGCKRIRIVNCWIHDSKSCGISLEGCEDVLIQGCRIEQVASGVYAVRSSGVQVIGNYVENVVGPMPRGQMVQFNGIKGENNLIRGNYGINFHGRSKPEDMISIYESSGTPNSPIVVEENYLSGDPKLGSDGKSGSGSGIMLGDGPGGQHIVCRKNILISPGQCGIGVAGGGDVTIADNFIVGGKSDVSNVGIYVWNQSKQAGGEVVVRGNKVHWVKADGAPNAYWNGGGFSKVDEEKNEFQDPKMLASLPSPPSAAPLPPIPYGKTVKLPWPKQKEKKP